MSVVRIQGRARTGAALLVGALFMGACGGDGAESTTTTTTAPATTSTSSTTTSTLPTTTTTSTTTPAIPATATTYVVQTDLTALGYFSGVIDGIAGDETRAAIARFQSDAGIEADGEFGPVTDAALFPRLQEDVPYVESVQETLAALELYTGPIDGDFGAGTQAAVERFQESCELEPTGELDIATRLCLFEV
jgi:N-acetylmuramoyl-L-alanine amidase